MDSVQYLKTQLEEAKDKKDEMLIYRAERALKEFEICATSETIDDLQRNLELGGFAPAITDEGMDKALEAVEASGDSAAITREIVRQAKLKAKSRIEAAQAARIKMNVSEKQFSESLATYDVFISHASEDKESFVRPFAEYLLNKGLKVWYDEFELKIGDSLRRKIDEGLSQCRYGVVVLSKAFFSKAWPQKELDGLFSRETNGEKIILPIWHNISKDEIVKYSPIITDMIAVSTADSSIDEIADKIVERVKK